MTTARQDDPRVRPLMDAITPLYANYDPHYASIGERMFMETMLFLARYDTLIEYYNNQVVSRTKLPIAAVAEGDRVIPIYGEQKPVDMILFCPKCGLQHIDNQEPHKTECGWHHDAPCDCDAWMNPPHRSHLCGYCGHIWRPADAATNGVLEIKTRGESDSKPVVRQVKPLDRFSPRWRHTARGTEYREIGRGLLECSGPNYPLEGCRLVAYQGEDNRIWFRVESEFEDGRFEKA